MSCRARDLMHDNPKLTTEKISHTLFDEFHELAERDHVSDEYLRNMAIGHAAQITELRALLAKWKAEENEKVKRK
jgi:hypothetical protein